ncbi:histidinol phosphatase, partial [Bradyrhizobium japonicum]
KHTLAWMEGVFPRLQERIDRGAYSSDWLDLYRIRAKREGLTVVGIVDHLYRFREFKPYFETYMQLADDHLGRLQRTWLDQVCVVSIEEYVAFIQSQKECWEADGVGLKLGIELDYFPGGEAVLASVIQRYPWDHVIGSVHFLNGWGFDNPDTKERFADTDLLALYGKVFHVVEKAISSRLFDIIAHLDNVKVFGYRPPETALLPYYQRVAKLLKRHNIATEINTGLYYRYPVKEMCPSVRFLEVLAQHQVPITTSSDSHFPDHLGNYLPQARELLKKAGYRNIVTFDRRKRRELPLL